MQPFSVLFGVLTATGSRQDTPKALPACTSWESCCMELFAGVAEWRPPGLLGLLYGGLTRP